MAHDIFISHSSEDGQIADAVCAALEAKEIRCWIAPRDVNPGTSYPAAITDGIEKAQIIVFLFTARSNQSRMVQKELEQSLNRGKIIIPFRLENVFPTQAIDFLIASDHWLDAVSPPLKLACRPARATAKGVLSRS
jgi:hypothetical protein